MSLSNVEFLLTLLQQTQGCLSKSLETMFPLTPRATAVPAPFSFSADQDFLGNDGLWSTFSIQVGTPAQTFHVLPSTSSQETWLPAVEGCTAADGSKCGAQRGVGVFRGVASSGFDSTQVGICYHRVSLSMIA